MQTVVRRSDIDPDDPFTYLYVMGEWYCFDPNEEPLGSGSMGTVYKGFRVKDGSVIAIKKVKSNYAQVQSIRDRAKQEASLAFRHQNLVEMIGYCEYGEPGGPIEAYILSCFVDGVPVDEYVKNHLVATENRVSHILNIILPVLDALSYIHSRGVVHRDIKPSNIMVGIGNNVRLMDLGIARMNGGNAYSQNGFIGTPQYSAPEQITSKDEISAATDLYALGITFYELLTGVNPFSDTSEAVTLAKQITQTLPNHEAVPRKLMKVLLKATQKDAAKRYQSALEMKEAIQKAAMPDNTPFQPFVDWAGENKAVVLSCSFVILAILIVLIFIL